MAAHAKATPKWALRPTCLEPRPSTWGPRPPPCAPDADVLDRRFGDVDMPLEVVDEQELDDFLDSLHEGYDDADGTSQRYDAAMDAENDDEGYGYADGMHEGLVMRRAVGALLVRLLLLLLLLGGARL